MSTPFDHILSCSRTADYTKPTATACRVAQVEEQIYNIHYGFGYTAQMREDMGDDLTRTLAAEVDARDEVITKLLAMLKPGKPPCDCISEIGPRCYCMNQGDAANVEAWWTTMCHYRHACEIAGRTE